MYINNNHDNAKSVIVGSYLSSFENLIDFGSFQNLISNYSR